ncbi:MAG: apolipoprotein N-acyltransferase [Bacteroidales bacterium]
MQKEMKPYLLWILSISSGLLLAASWPTQGFTPLIFIAWIPLLWVEDYVFNKQIENDKRKEQATKENLQFSTNSCSEIENTKKATGLPTEIKKIKPKKYYIFGYAFVSFLVWNILTTYWVWNSTPAAILAFVANAFFMAITFYLYHFTCRRFFKKGLRCLILLVYWIAFEYFHHNWDISWPWLTLGNVFSSQPQWIQWYEFTGTLGGSLWILACNFAFLSWIKAVLNKSSKQTTRKKALIVCAFILIPVFGSMARYATYKEKGRKVEVVVVQPNIDPYEEQYNISPLEAVDRMLFLTECKITPATRFVVTPESMIQEYVWEDRLGSSPSIQNIRSFLKNYPKIDLIAGISTYSWLSRNDSNAQGARKTQGGFNLPSPFYRAHNTVLVLDSSSSNNDNIPRHHKSKLTPGVEIMPFVDKIKILEKLALNLGGIVGTLGIDENPVVFTSTESGTKPSESETFRFSDIICYESIFGEFVSQTVKDGAEILFISTNDGWWKNTSGHKQHASYARLRAVENRRDIARSANTGISCFINQKGQVFQATEYGKPAVISHKMKANNHLTIYAQYGDILGRICLPTALIFLLLSVIYGFVPKAWKEFRRCKKNI